MWIFPSLCGLRTFCSLGYPNSLSGGAGLLWPDFACCPSGLGAYSSISKLVAETKGDLFAGFDVGRTRNTSELIILERKAKRLVYRMGRSFCSASVGIGQTPV